MANRKREYRAPNGKGNAGEIKESTYRTLNAAHEKYSAWEQALSMVGYDYVRPTGSVIDKNVYKNKNAYTRANQRRDYSQKGKG